MAQPLKMRKTVKIYLYLAIPSTIANTPIERKGFKFIRNRLRRLYDIALWTLFRRTRVHYYTFEDHQHSNRGDIALQQAMKLDLEETFNDRTVEIQEIAWGNLDEQLLEKVNAEGSLFLIGGSGYLHVDYNGNLSRILRNDLPILQRMKCPKATLGIGVNFVLMSDDALTRFSYSKETDGLLADFASTLDLISVRDRRAEAALSGGMSMPRLIADPALFFPDESQQIRTGSNGKEQVRVGLNFSLHGADSQNTLHRNLPIYARVLKRLQKRHGIKYVYFLHSDAEHFIWLALQIAGVDAELVDTTPREMLEAYKSVDIHVSQMMHSSIMSMSVCTPTLNLAYDVKTLSFFELMGVGDLAMNAYIVTEDGLEAAIESLIEKRGSVHTTLVQRVDELRSGYSDFLLQLRETTLGQHQMEVRK